LIPRRIQFFSPRGRFLRYTFRAVAYLLCSFSFAQWAAATAATQPRQRPTTTTSSDDSNNKQTRPAVLSVNEKLIAANLLPPI